MNPNAQHDSREDFGQAWQGARRALGDLVEFVTAAIYFEYWFRRAPIRHSLYCGSLRVFQLTTVIIVLEVVHKLKENELLCWIVDKIHQYKTPALVVVFIAALFLFWHHQHETRKPEYEYKFVKRLYELIERSRHTGTPVQPDELLTILRSAFARTGIRRVSVHLPDREETLLSIKPEHVVPPEEDPRYFIKLPLKRGADGKLSGEGVAGAVYVDNIPRYMPRLSFPNWERGISFRHCVRVAYRKDRKKGRVRRVWDAIVTRLGRKPKELEPDFVNDGFNLRAFKESEKGTRLYNSALSVPLKSVTSGRCVGVLNFDFESTSTLDKSDIAMAVVFGLLCGDVIEK